MHRNVVIGIVVVIVLLVLGWWYWAFMMPASSLPAMMPGEEMEAVDRPEDESFSIAGTWRSTQDPRFVRTFSVDGSVTDTYEGDESATVSGSWNIVEKPSREQAEFPDLDGTRVIKVQFPEEVMYFAILAQTENELSMSLLGGNGSTLSFARVR